MDAFYKEAEKRIAQALQEGAIVLDLSSMNLTKIPETIAHSNIEFVAQIFHKCTIANNTNLNPVKGLYLNRA